MDKLKVVLAILRKYHFWFLVGGGVVVALGTWWLATGALANRFEKRSGELDSLVGEVRQVFSDTSVPNQTTVANINAEHEKLKEHVLEAWELLYEEQKRNNPVPDVLGSERVQEEFRAYFERQRPGEEMPVRLREAYRDFISKYFLTLLELVDRLHLEGQEDPRESGNLSVGRRSSRGVGPARGRGGPMAEMGPGMLGPMRRNLMPGPGDRTRDEEDVPELIGIVEWEQPEIFGIANWDERPTTQQVMLAQEDLWVYEALLRMIRNVNEGVESHEKAWIQRINRLEIGRDAADAWVQSQAPIFQAHATAPGGGTMGGPPMGGGEMGGSPMGLGGAAGGPPMALGGGPMGIGGGPMGGGQEEGGDQWLLNGRYVDENGFPISAEKALNEPPYAEFKMMMVCMDLDMHQRHLADLLVECANSAMPVEVVRVRVNPGEGGAVDFAGRSAQGGGGPPMGGARRRPTAGPQLLRGGGLGPMMGGATRSGGASALDNSQDYMNVEIFGIIYIYNRPDRATLGTGTAGSEEPGEGPGLDVEPSNQRIPGGVDPAGESGPAETQGDAAAPPAAGPGVPPAAAPAAGAPRGAAPPGSNAGAGAPNAGGQENGEPQP